MFSAKASLAIILIAFASVATASPVSRALGFQPVPDSLILIVPSNGSYINDPTGKSACFGIDQGGGGGSGGFSREVNFTVTYPSGEIRPAGTILGSSACAVSMATDTFCVNATQAGNYKLDVLVTIGIPAAANCTLPFTYQTESLSSTWTMLDQDATTTGQEVLPYTTVVKYTSSPTGSVQTSVAAAASTTAKSKSAGMVVGVSRLVVGLAVAAGVGILAV